MALREVSFYRNSARPIDRAGLTKSIAWSAPTLVLVYCFHRHFTNLKKGGCKHSSVAKGNSYDDADVKRKKNNDECRNKNASEMYV